MQFLMRWFQYTVEEFEHTHNPHNAAVIVMNRASCADGQDHMMLTDESREICGLNHQHKVYICICVL